MSPARQTAVGVAAVALCFTLFVLVEMFLTWNDLRASRPVDHPQLTALRADLAREPGSDMIKGEIRRVELLLRDDYLTAHRRIGQGAWMLLVAVATFAAATKVAMAKRRPTPVLADRPLDYDPDRGAVVFGRASVVGITAVLAASAVAIPILHDQETEVEAAHGVWPRFRGVGGLAISDHANLPTSFDARDGQEENLRWKAVVPMPGMSSPVIWNDRVFLTGASENSREVYCFDALQGSLLWRRPVSAGPESSQAPENIWEETGYAAPSAVTDGAHVWALFANGDVVCLDVFGQEKWCIHLGLPDNMYGLAASPMLYEDKLILQVDQEWGDDGPRSALIALDAATGEEAWRTAREVDSSWPTPIPVEAPRGTLVVTCANPYTIAYDPTDGTEVWRVDHLSGDGGPSPTVSDGLVLAVNIGSPLAAIRPDGEGDVTDTHVAWQYDDGLPDVCSMLAHDGLAWMLATDGLLTCLDMQTGEAVWQHGLERMFYASPALAAGRLYLIDRDGEVTVLEEGREFREVGVGRLGERCDTSPAFAEGRVYIRGRRHLFCFGGPTP